MNSPRSLCLRDGSMRSRTSTRQKGATFQRWCKKWLEEQGYVVHNQPVASKLVYVKSKACPRFPAVAGLPQSDFYQRGGGRLRWVSVRNDIFGVDLIAIKKGEKPRYIQCTEHHGIEKRYAEFIRFPWPLEHCSVELWTKKELGRVVIRCFTGDVLERLGEIERRKLKIYGSTPAR